MIVVQNKFQTKKGFAEKMGARFTQNNLETFKGFIRVEVLMTQGLEETDELSVNMYWEDKESFETWRNSDSFKKSHARPAGGSPEAKQESPIISNKISIFDVVAVKEGAAAQQ